MRNPIHEALGIDVGGIKHFAIGDTTWTLFPAREGYVETLYRRNPGHGESNPGLSFGLNTQLTALGHRLAGSRVARGMKRAEAEAFVASACRDKIVFASEREANAFEAALFKNRVGAAA